MKTHVLYIFIRLSGSDIENVSFHIRLGQKVEKVYVLVFTQAPS